MYHLYNNQNIQKKIIIFSQIMSFLIQIDFLQTFFQKLF